MDFSNNQASSIDHDETGDNTVTVRSNTSSLLKALSATFTNSTTVLGELLQNARRAGATKVDIHLDDELIVVQDNGIGIDDIAILFSIADSGWELSVQESDSPYGIGFASCLFVTEAVGVMSKGKHLYASTQDLLSLKPAPVNDSMDLGVTEIRLHGHRLGMAAGVKAALERMVRGFPIPVFINGVEAARPHAIDQTELIETPIGLASPGVRLGAGVSNVYLQGLPISGHIVRRARSGGAIVHLNSPQFQGRMPDRAELRNPVESGNIIQDALDEVAKEHVRGLAACMAEDEFLDKHGDLAIALRMNDLLNGLSVIPKQWVSEFAEEPRLTGENGRERYRYVTGADELPLKAVSKAVVLSRGLYQVDFDGRDYESSLAAHAVWGLAGLVADGIPTWHWAHALVTNIEDKEPITLGYETIVGEEELNVFGEHVQMRVVEKLWARLPTSVVSASSEGMSIDTVEIAAYMDWNEYILYVKPSTCARVAVSQVSTFEVDDSYQEDGFWQSIRQFDSVMNAILHADGAELVKAFIDEGMMTKAPGLLRGKSFIVAFDQDGRLTVVDK